MIEGTEGGRQEDSEVVWEYDVMKPSQRRHHVNQPIFFMMGWAREKHVAAAVLLLNIFV